MDATSFVERGTLLILHEKYTHAAMIPFLFAPRVHASLYISGLLFGLGNGAYLSLYWTLLSDLVPEGETSKYIGLMQYTMQIPWAITPTALGPVVDGFGAESGKGYDMLFSVIVVFLFIGMLLAFRIPETLKNEFGQISQNGRDETMPLG